MGQTLFEKVVWGGKGSLERETLDVDTHFSAPWSMTGASHMAIETDPDGTIEATITLQRSNSKRAFSNPDDTARVKWHDVSVSEADITDPLGGGEGDIHEFSGVGAHAYRLKAVVTVEGDIRATVAAKE